MARQFNDIQKSILDAREASEELTALQVLTPEEISTTQASSTSSVAIWRQWVWIVAFVIFTFEQILDKFRADVEQRIAETRPHTARWYVEKALLFQFGHELVPEKDYYNNSGLSEDEIQDSRIVANAAAVKQIISGAGILRLKTVTWAGDEWAALQPAQVEALSSYFNNSLNGVADAGTFVLVTTAQADDLLIVVDMYYNPQVIAADGSRLDGTESTPAQDAAVEFLKSIDFNGSLILSNLEDKLKSVAGFPVAHIRQAASKYAGYAYTDTGANVGPIVQIRVADAGWMKLDQVNSVFNFIPFTE